MAGKDQFENVVEELKPSPSLHSSHPKNLLLARSGLSTPRFSLGGLFFGGELGFLTGTASASRTITKDPEARERIEKAFKNYRIDVMKQEIQSLEGKSKLEKIFG